MKTLVALWAVLLMPTITFADCIVLDFTILTSAERNIAPHIIAGLIGSKTTTRSRDASSLVDICHPTLSVASLTAGSIQTAAATFLTTQSTNRATEETEVTTLQQEVRTNQVCNVANLQEAIDRITIQKTAIQVDIDAVTNIATAKVALTTANNRLTAINIDIVKCFASIIKLIRRGRLE